MEVKTEKTAIIAVADTHINSTWALCPPKVRLDNGGVYKFNKYQKWLWDKWLDFCAEVKVLTDNYRRVIVLDGDLTELDTSKRSIQLITLNKDTVIAAAIQALTPLLDIADAIYVIRGTSAHTGKSQWSEEAIGREIGSVRADNGDHAHYQYLGVASGVRVDIAHHGLMGSSPFTRGNAGNTLAIRTAWNYVIAHSVKPPHLVIRSHNHNYVSSGDHNICEVNFLPAWSLKTEYCYRIGLENDVSDIGGIIYYCNNGRYFKDKLFYRMKEKAWVNTM